MEGVFASLQNDSSLELVEVPATPNLPNPVFRDANEYQDRDIVDTHFGIYCDGVECSKIPNHERTYMTKGPRYKCLDCHPFVDFCETCVLLQDAVGHSSSHRLLLLEATLCTVCRDNRLEPHPGDQFRGPYMEYTAPVATMKRVAESGRCAHCIFLWTIMEQHPPEEGWPYPGKEKLTIRTRKPWHNCVEFSVLQDKNVVEKDIVIQGRTYTQRTQSVEDQEYELKVFWNLRKLPPVFSSRT